MKRWTYIATAAIPAVFLLSTPCNLLGQNTSEPDIRGVWWGMGMAEVERKETAQVRHNPNPYDGVYKRYGVTDLKYKGKVGEIEAEIRYVFLHNELFRLSYHFQEIERDVSTALLKKYGKSIPEKDFNTDDLKMATWRNNRTEVWEMISYESEAHFVTYTSLKHSPEWLKVNKKVKDVISKETADDL